MNPVITEIRNSKLECKEQKEDVCKDSFLNRIYLILKKIVDQLTEFLSLFANLMAQTYMLKRFYKKVTLSLPL